MDTKNGTKGFSLIELMITIALLAILLAFAGPGFQELIERNKIRTITDEFYTAFNAARSESIKRNQPVTICASSTGATCDAANWDSGWLIFTDEDGNGDVNAGEVITQVGSALPSGYTLRAAAPYSSSITMNPDGAINGVNGAFRVCPHDADITKSRSISFLSVGRPRLQEGTAQCP